MEMLQTHCYATGTVMLLWKRHQGPNMSQYIDEYARKIDSTAYCTLPDTFFSITDSVLFHAVNCSKQ
jgi:hypothetical protein